MKRFGVVALVVVGLGISGRANGAQYRVLNLSNNTLHIAVMFYAPAFYQSEPDVTSAPNRYITEGWFTIAPGRQGTVYDGDQPVIWVRVAAGDAVDGTAAPPPNSLGSAQGWVSRDRFEVVEDVSTNPPKKRFTLNNGPNLNHGRVVEKPDTAGFTRATGFYKVGANGTFRYGSSKTKTKSYDFAYEATYNNTKILADGFPVPEKGGHIIDFKVAVVSEHSTRSITWIRRNDEVRLSGSVSGSDNPFDRWRGAYKGTLTIEYLPPGAIPGMDTTGITLIDPTKPAPKLKTTGKIDPHVFDLKKTPPAATPSGAHTTLKCEFTNKTPDTVQFRLNGGKGLSASLAPGKTAAYSVVVTADRPPAVFIKQKNGTELNFALKDGDRYVFTLRDGKIVNAYK